MLFLVCSVSVVRFRLRWVVVLKLLGVVSSDV